MPRAWKQPLGKTHNRTGVLGRPEVFKVGVGGNIREKLKKRSGNRLVLLHFTRLLSVSPACLGRSRAVEIYLQVGKVGEKGEEFHFWVNDIVSIMCWYQETFIMANTES